MRFISMVLAIGVSIQLSAATLNVPEFSMTVVGNRHTDLSQFEFTGLAGGSKSGGFMFWQYQEDVQDIVDLGNGRFLFKPMTYWRYALTGTEHLRYRLIFGPKNLRSYQEALLFTQYGAQELESSRGEALKKLSQETLYVTTFPTSDKLSLKVNTFIGGTEERIAKNCAEEKVNEESCIIEIGISIRSPLEKEKYVTRVPLYRTRANSMNSHEFLEYSPLFPHRDDEGYTQTLVARASFVKPEKFRATLGVWLRYKNRGYYIETAPHDFTDLDNINLTSHYGQLTLTIKEEHKLK